MHPAALARAVADAVPVDALAVYDGGHTTFWSNDFTPVHAVRTRLHEPGMSHLGFGLPFALAMQLQHPGRPVFNITGDGSFGFTLQELDTARRALHERKVIERAKGALMSRLGLSEEEAFRALQKASMDHNKRLLDVAEATLALPDFAFASQVRAAAEH